MIAPVPPPVSAGPVINGEPTFMTIYTADQFRSFTHFPQLIRLINAAFAKRHVMFGDLVSTRLNDSAQLLSEMGTEAFVVVISSPHSGESSASSGDASTSPIGPEEQSVQDTTKIYGFVYARSMASKAGMNVPEDLKKFKNKAMPGPGVVQWEVNLLAIDHSLIGKIGLGTWLMKKVEGEIENKFNEGGRGQVCEAVLSTVKVVNYGWYVKRGYELTGEEWFDKGTKGASEGFHLAHLRKVLAKA